jgi:hypothetical protein
MTWETIVAEARRLHQQFTKDGSTAWYRGHRNAAFRLEATLHRYVSRLQSGLKSPLNDGDRLRHLRQEYKSIYRTFKRDAWPMLDAASRSEWGIIFTMQHYGLPTRLLDWTENFACAVFFAQKDRISGEDAVVWVLDPQALNKLAIQRDGQLALDDDTSDGDVSRAWHPKWTADDGQQLPSVAVAPLFTNMRMTAQRSAFVLSGDSGQPLDKEFPSLAAEGKLVKLTLPHETFDHAGEFLAAAGVDAFTFYPDLFGLALRHEAETCRRLVQFRHAYPKAFES